MLVKFLSFVISVLGTARYKAVFLSCLALVLSLTGITALVLHSSNQPRDAASSAVEQTKDGVGTQSFSPQLPGNKQPAKEQSEQSQTDSQNSASNTSTAPDNSSNSTKPATAAGFDFVIGKTPASVAADSTSDAITVTTGDNSDVTWQFATDNDGAHIITTQNSASNSASFQIQTSKDMPSGTVITIAISARDSARNINTTKTFTVTVQ